MQTANPYNSQNNQNTHYVMMYTIHECKLLNVLYKERWAVCIHGWCTCVNKTSTKTQSIHDILLL